MYPRFDSLARLWASFEEELQVTRARQTTLATLATYQDSYVPTCAPTISSAARQLRRAEEAMGEMPPPSTLPPVDEAAVAEALAAGDTTPAGAAGAMDEEKGKERVSGDELVDATLELSGFCQERSWCGTRCCSRRAPISLRASAVATSALQMTLLLSASLLRPRGTCARCCGPRARHRS